MAGAVRSPFLLREDEYEDMVFALEGRLMNMAVNPPAPSTITTVKKKTSSTPSSSSAKRESSKTTNNPSTSADASTHKQRSIEQSFSRAMEKLDADVSKREHEKRRSQKTRGDTAPDDIVEDTEQTLDQVGETNDALIETRRLVTTIEHLYSWFDRDENRKCANIAFLRATLYKMYPRMLKTHIEKYEQIMSTPANERDETQIHELDVLEKINKVRMYRATIIGTLYVNVIKLLEMEIELSKSAERRIDLPVGHKSPFDLAHMLNVMREMMLRNIIEEYAINTKNNCYTCMQRPRQNQSSALTFSYAGITEERSVENPGLRPWTQTFCTDCATALRSIYYLIHQFSITNTEVYNKFREHTGLKFAEFRDRVSKEVTNHIAGKMSTAFVNITKRFGQLLQFDISPSLAAGVAVNIIEDIYGSDDPRISHGISAAGIAQFEKTKGAMKKFVSIVNNVPTPESRTVSQIQASHAVAPVARPSKKAAPVNANTKTPTKRAAVPKSAPEMQIDGMMPSTSKKSNTRFATNRTDKPVIGHKRKRQRVEPAPDRSSVTIEDIEDDESD